MQIKKGFLLLGVVAIGSLSIAKPAAAQNKTKLLPTPVEAVLPSQPFQATLVVPGSFGGSIFATGPAQGTLGVTSLVVTNLTPDPQRIEIFQPILRSNALDCGGGVQGSGGPGSIDLILNLQPNQTLSLPFPSPLVFTPIDGHSCIAMSITGNAIDAVRAYVTGFVN